MENTPLNVDNQSEVVDKKDSKKKKKAEKIGSFLVLPETKPKAKEDDKKTVLETLLGTDKKQEKPNELDRAEAESKSTVEKNEAEKSLAELSPDEKQFIEREYVQAYTHGEVEVGELPEEIAAEAAVEDFHSKIQAGMDSEEAYVASISELEVKASEIQESEEEKQSTITRNIGKLSEFIMPDREEASEKFAENELPESRVVFDFLQHPKEPAKNPFKTEKYREKEESSQPIANPAGAALLGGIVGYLVGRRRGKISGEKKLLTVQKKLQKEVVNLGWQLSVKEEAIRQAARRNSYIAGQNESIRPKTEKTRIAPERLGHVIVSSERVIFTREQNIKPKAKVEAEAPKVTKHVENLKRGELLEISRKIIVDGTSLRQIYESHLIGERGLRRLVKEHLKGGNVKKALRRELMQREIDFERDPIMRDQAINTIEHSESKGLEVLIEKAVSSLPFDSGSPLSFDKKPEIKIEVKTSHNRVRALDVLLSSVIAILAAAVILLLLKNY